MDFIFEAPIWLIIYIPLSVIIIAVLLISYLAERKQARKYYNLALKFREANELWKGIADDAFDIANKSLIKTPPIP